jgi:hypothetical protein
VNYANNLIAGPFKKILEVADYVVVDFEKTLEDFINSPKKLYYSNDDQQKQLQYDNQYPLKISHLDPS